MAPMSTPRQRARERTEQEIRSLAWQHLERDGAAALSLRAIARDLGVVSSAIYRYVPSRDELLTVLIIEGYDDLADAVEAAEGVVDRHDFRGRWLAVSHAVRAWARRRSAAWSLLYGSPVPGYEAPGDRTTPAGTRVVVLLARIMAEAVSAGAVDRPVGPGVTLRELDDPVRTSLMSIAREVGADAASPEAVLATMVGWTSVLGAVSSEVFGQLGPDPLGDPDTLADLTFTMIADVVGLTVRA